MENLVEEKEQIKELLSTPKYIVTITHKNPDGDAIGASLAMRRFLESMGHTVKTLFPSDYPRSFDFFPDIKKALVAEIHQEDCTEAMRRADLFFCLDFNSLDRMDWLAKDFIHLNKPKILIDHHIDPEPFADYTISDPSASSTAELVYLFAEELGLLTHMDQQAAEYIFAGILTDTGSFRYSTSARLFRVTSELKEIGVDDYWLQIRLFNSFTEKQLRLLGHCLANRMEVIDDQFTGIIYLTKQDYKDFQIQRGDTEGIVNYILMMRHIKVAIFISEQPQVVKLSLRSQGDISVQQMASAFFHGGGHKNASGGISHKTLDETIRFVKDILPEFIYKQLNYAK